MSDAAPGALRMDLGARHAGETFHDVIGGCPDPVVIGEDGFGAFPAAGKSLSVWVRDGAFEDITINE